MTSNIRGFARQCSDIILRGRPIACTPNHNCPASQGMDSTYLSSSAPWVEASLRNSCGCDGVRGGTKTSGNATTTSKQFGGHYTAASVDQREGENGGIWMA